MQKPLCRTTASGWPELARRLKKLTGKAALASGMLMAGWLNPETIKAQSIASNYTFAASSGTYTPLGASATQLPQVKADTYISPVIPIGFTFNFDEVDYTGFRVSSNGFISFNPSSGAETTNNLSTVAASARPLVAPLWDDLDGRATGDISNASYEVTGTAGSQVFTFEWRNWEWLYNSNDPVISFQVKLYEGSNKIEFIYQQESGAVVSGSASIGIAGVGSGNFLSLNNTTASPTASSSTSTNNINTKPATGQIYTFNRNPLPAIDVATTGLVSPGTAGCFGTNQTVQVAIKNSGSAPLDFATTPVTVNAAVTGTNATTFPAVIVNTGTLAPGASQNVTIASNFDMSTAGTYTFNASATATGDARAFNDAMAPVAVTVTSKQVAGPVALPQTVDFTGFTGSNLTTVFPNWNEASGASTPSGTTSSWTNKSGLGGTGNITAKINLFSNSAREWIIGPKVTPTATTALRFKAAVTNYDALTPDPEGMTGTDDKVQVMVSTDCGATFTPVFTMDAASNLTNTLATQTVSLAAYAGQEIIVAFFATEGTVNDAPDYDFHIDDIFIGTPPAADLGAIAVVNPPSTGCYSATQNIEVTIQNFGTSPVDFAATNATVSVRTHGALANTISIPVTTGTLAPGATQNVTVGTLNMTAPGTYNFRAYTTFTGDNNAVNDTVSTTRTVVPVAALPQDVDFTGFTGSNLTTVFPNWREASGATTPAGTTSSWTNKSGLGATGNITAKINLFAASKNEWIVGPKVAATTSTALQFKAAVTNYDALTPDPDGMTGTDDKVQVMVSTDCGATFTPVFTMDAASNLTNTLATQTVSLAAYAGQEIIVAFFATEGTVNDAPDYDFHIDDIKLYEQTPVELAVETVTLPGNSCGLTTTETICITIRNNGSSATTTIPVSYTINGGTAVTETAALVIAPGASAQYCFTTKADFSVVGTYTVVATANATGDADATNNSATGIAIAKPTIATFPYTQGFENGNGGWTASGTNSSWALGTPAGTVITGAGGGSNSWVTNLTGNYPDNENSAVTSPCFNFTNIANPAISLKIWWLTEFSWDGAVLQSSIDGGITWQNVGAYQDPNNWFNDNSIGAGPGGQTGSTAQGWTGTGTNSSGGWVTASHALTGLSGQSSVILRIAFASDGSTVNEGFAFDDISIFNDVAVPTVTAGGPTTFCSGGSVVLTAASATTGVTYQWLLDSTPISGATNATYTATASGSYTVETSAGGTTTASAPTVITVNSAAATPTITAGGATTFCTGGSVTLTAASTTTGATYEWFLDGTAIAGATSATYTANAAGNYTVVATASGCPSVASAATAVTVNATPATPTVTRNGAVLTSSAATGNQWYLDGTLIPGATGATHTATSNGTYTVVVTGGGCDSDPSAPLVITNLSAGKALASTNVQVYPNPANGSFNVKLQGYQKEATVVLYNLAGQQITTEKVAADGNAKNIDISGLAAGTYLLKVTSDKNVQITRLVIQ